MSSVKIRFLRSDSASSVNVDGEEIILNSDNGNYISLNPVAADVWHMLGTPRSIDEIVAKIVETYEVELMQCEHDISRLMEDMKVSGIVVEIPVSE